MIYHGANLIPEGLETGEFKVGGVGDLNDFEPRYIIAFTGDTFQGGNINQDGYSYNGIFSSVTFIVTNVLRVALQIINNEGNGDKILTVFTVPRFAVQEFTNEQKGEYYALKMDEDFKASPIIKDLISTPSNLDGYIPRNQKLRTYPFMYLGFNPQNGGSKVFRYEDFSNGTPSFKIISEINPNPSINFIPQNYRGNSGDSLQDTVAMNGYPTISYKNDVFNTWLAQNSEIVNLQMQQEQYNYEVGMYQTVASGMNSIIGKASEGDLSALTEGASLGLNLAKQEKNHEFYIKNQMAQIEKQKLLPDTATLSSSNATLMGYDFINKNIFTRYTIKKQFAQRIDKYFDMYGYLTNTVKIPNLNNRPNWNYIKTIGVNILGDIPQEDLQTIKNMFDNGITLWHNKNTFLDYSQNNR